LLVYSADTCGSGKLASPQIPRARALVRFARYKAAQEGALQRIELVRGKGFFPRVVSEAGPLQAVPSQQSPRLRSVAALAGRKSTSLPGAGGADALRALRRYPPSSPA